MREWGSPGSPRGLSDTGCPTLYSQRQQERSGATSRPSGWYSGGQGKLAQPAPLNLTPPLFCSPPFSCPHFLPCDPERGCQSGLHSGWGWGCGVSPPGSLGTVPSHGVGCRAGITAIPLKGGSHLNAAQAELSFPHLL